MTKIHVITEGATERQAGLVLWKHAILSKQARPQPHQWKSPWDSSREGYEYVIQQMQQDQVLKSLRKSRRRERLLLVFDQESAQNTQSRADVIGQDLGIGFQSIDGYTNLFSYTSLELKVVLHISDAGVDSIGRRDFDGYILQLLQGPHKERVAQRLVPAKCSPQELLIKAETEITRLMANNGYPWTHAKSWLYAYITAFQSRQSHVWFARDVLEAVLSDGLRDELEGEVRQVFASLIAAWNLLLQGGEQ